jgi:hypothetical protein
MGVDLDPISHILEMRGGVKADFGRVTGFAMPVAMRSEDSIEICTCGAFALRACDVDHIQTIKSVHLQG